MLSRHCNMAMVPEFKTAHAESASPLKDYRALPRFEEILNDHFFGSEIE